MSRIVHRANLRETPIDFTSTGDNTVVAAVAAQIVRVYRLFLVVSAATDLTFKKGSTALTGAIEMTEAGSIVFDFEDQPWFTTELGEAFVIGQTGTAQVSGRLYYTQV